LRLESTAYTPSTTPRNIACASASRRRKGRRELDQVASHVLEGPGECNDLGATARKQESRRKSRPPDRVADSAGTAAAARCAAPATVQQQQRRGSAGKPSSRGGARIRPLPSRSRRLAVALRPVQCPRRSTRRSGCSTQTGRALDAARHAFGARQRRRMQFLEIGLDVVRASSTGGRDGSARPACSDRQWPAGRRNSAMRRRVSRRGWAPRRGADQAVRLPGRASMKRSPWSVTASSVSFHATLRPVLAMTFVRR